METFRTWALRMMTPRFAFGCLSFVRNSVLLFLLKFVRFFKVFSSFSWFRVWRMVEAFILAEFNVLSGFWVNKLRIFCLFSSERFRRPIWELSSEISFVRFSTFFCSTSFFAFASKPLTFPGALLNFESIDFLSCSSRFILFRISSNFFRFSATFSPFLCFLMEFALRFIVLTFFTVLNSSMIALRSDTLRLSVSSRYV